MAGFDADGRVLLLGRFPPVPSLVFLYIAIGISRQQPLVHFLSNALENLLDVEVVFGAGLEEVGLDAGGQGLPLRSVDRPLLFQIAFGGCNGDNDILVGKVANVLQPGGYVVERLAVIDSVGLNRRVDTSRTAPAP